MRFNSKNSYNKLLFDISTCLLIVIASFTIIMLFSSKESYSLSEKWDGVSIANNFSGGNGTEENPFLIENGAQFAYFKSLIEGNDYYQYRDKYYSLIDNIDLGGKDWVAIGNYDITNNITKSFSGHLNGNGYTIKDFAISNPNVINGENYYGLFSILEDATISNLNITNGRIVPISTNGVLNIGMIAGKAYNNVEDTMDINISNIGIQNASIDIGNVVSNSSSKIGGVVGSLSNYATMSNVFIKLNLNANYANCGGRVVGYLDSAIMNVVSVYTPGSLLIENLDDYGSITSNGNIFGNFRGSYTNNTFSVTLDDEAYDLDELVDAWNSTIDPSYSWVINQDNMIISINDENSNVTMSNLYSFMASPNINVHASGVDGNSVYINDIDSDYKEFMARNYTHSENGVIPTSEKKNVYNSSNLVKVYTGYLGRDVNNSNLVGTINTDVNVNNLYYYNYYEVKDGYVNFTLIDNPYSVRPNNKGFNGWVTDYSGAVISYDKDYYERNVKIPVNIVNGVCQDISITFYATWTEATATNMTTTGSSAWNNAMEDLNDVGMQLIDGYSEEYNMEDYFTYGGRINRWSYYPSNSYDRYGDDVDGSYCRTSGGCDYYYMAGNSYDPNEDYYTLRNGTLQYQIPEATIVSKDGLPDGSYVSGYYSDVNINYGQSIDGYYDYDGTIQSGYCSNYGGCSLYKLNQFYNSDGSENVAVNGANYFYLVTRDTNFIVLRSNQGTMPSTANNKPFTLTSYYNGASYMNNYLNIQSTNFHCRADTVFENLYIYTTQNSTNSIGSFSSATNTSKYIYGDWNNFKIGRGIKRNGTRVNAIGFLGGSNSGTGSSSNITKYKLIVESGYFSDGAIVNGGSGSAVYTEAKAIMGNDYDRVNEDNDNFTITDCISASWGGDIHASSNTKMSSDVIYKSGTFGSGKGGNTSGIYTGQRQGGNAYALRNTTIQGGWFYVVNGGPSVGTNMRTLNSVFISITGGEIQILFGGAGQTTTYGNRIIQMTGGKIYYALFGGSNAYNDTSNAGTIYGSSYVYIAGDSQIGDESIRASSSPNLFNAYSGCVFGHGNGKNGSTVVGSNDNATVIVDESAHILGNIYGGSNNGQAGSTTNTGSTNMKIIVKNGTIDGNIYGGGNNNGLGSTSVTANVDISVTGGTIKGSVFGGTRTKGIVYGNANVNVLNGSILTDVYGGGEGGYSNDSNPGTYITNNIDVNIGSNDVSSIPNIGNNVYGGSAFGTVNATTRNDAVNTNKHVNVNVNSGKVVGSVFGGGKGSTTYTPHIKGVILVKINGGNIGNVFGGFDANGIPESTDEVQLIGGTIGYAYGGGNSASVTTTKITLMGSTVTYNLFGGSNSKGVVTTSNVFVKSGSVVSIYGGNNAGTSTTNTNVEITGGTITGDIYGGGKSAPATKTDVLINYDGSSLKNIFGGGESANADNTLVTINKGKIDAIYGGSNTMGNVTNGVVTINNGTIGTIYGGNNKGGQTSISTINFNKGTATKIYGGGSKASGTTSNVYVNDGVVGSVFGGGSEAGLTTANVNYYGGNVTDIYGGSDTSGNITTANVNVDSHKSDVGVNITSTPVQATWQSSTYATYATVSVTLTNNTAADISNWQLFLGIPNSEIHSNYSNTDLVAVTGGYACNSVNKYYTDGTNTLTANGGTYTFEFNVLTNVSVADFAVSSMIVAPVSNNNYIKASNVYGGNNKGGKTSTAKVKIKMGNIDNVFGGGNQANIGSSNVEINNSIIDNLYGGGNIAGVDNSTFLNVNDSTINNNVYGGGNEGVVGKNTSVYITNVDTKGSIYAGGNGTTAIVSGNTFVAVDGNSIVGVDGGSVPDTGCVFGGGNAAATGTNATDNSTTTVNISGGYIHGNVYGGANTSVVYGKTDTNIGLSAIDDTDFNYVEAPITIDGSVFGGGESNAAGSENYDFYFISVTKEINISINGNGYLDNGHSFKINGSIFGSGNASSSRGESSIYIKDLGTKAVPSTNISIQRAQRVVIDHSVIQLEGTTDTTNDLVRMKYSFNRIDLLTIKNSTTLLLKHNANLLKELHSCVDVNGSEVKASVSINDDDRTVTKNTDNRIYMLPNVALNIATSQNTSSVGRITGMTFFGMYNSYAAGSYSYGVYDNSVNYGDSANAGLVIAGGSYVLGLNESQNITVDGFYTNNLTEDYSEVITSYIQPTPPDSNYYKWAIGVESISQEFTLTASRFSSLGTYQLTFNDASLTKGDTIFHVLGFNSEGLANGVSLVDSNVVPRITNTAQEANSTLGLSMKSETREWTNYGTTKFLSNNNGAYSGETNYKTDSDKQPPSLMFYLYHAKNITSNGELGTVVVTLQAEIPKNEIETELKLITITINIEAVNKDLGDAYDASITYDKKYEMPSATTVNITNQSQFTAYYSLFATSSTFAGLYGNDNSNYHALVSSYALPVGTQITMLDYGVSQDNPQYYYYNVSQAIYNNSLTQLQQDGEITYKLSDFVKMGSTSGTNTYKDKDANRKYYSEDYDRTIEEFIFIFDLKNTTATGDHIDNTMYFELRNKEDRSLISVASMRQSWMHYSLHDSSNIVLDQTINQSNNYLYYTVPMTIGYQTSVVYDETSTRDKIINTNYESSCMGLNIYLFDNSNNQVSSSMLNGTSIKMNGINYFADSDGVFRIKLAGKVSNLNRTFYFTTNSLLPPGKYTIRYVLFASPDGIHNSSLDKSSIKNYDINVVGNDNALVAYGNDKEKLVDGTSGLTQNNTNYVEYNFTYKSVLNRPNVRVDLYKRDITDSTASVYNNIPFSNFFTNVLPRPEAANYVSTTDNQLLLVNGDNGNFTKKFIFKENLASGTYKIVFRLFDDNQLIEEENKYVIVTKPTDNS